MSSSELEPEIPYVSTIDGTPDFHKLEAQSATRSLGKVAEDCFAPVEANACTPSSETNLEFLLLGIILTGDIDTAIIKALTSWYRLQHLVASGIAEKVLSWNQRYSYQLLFDWWMGILQDPLIPLFELETFINLSDTLKSEKLNENMMDTDHRDLWACINQHKKALATGNISALEERNHSRYNVTLIHLFIMEFLSPAVVPIDSISYIPMLASARRDAANHAYTMQAAVYCFGPQLPKLPLRNFKQAEHRSPYSWVCSAEASDPMYLRTLSKGPLLRACSWLDPPTSTSTQKPYQGSTPFNDGLDGWPEYLWDIENRQTVCTRDLTEKNPAYIAVSHTWGRWQKEDEQVFIKGGLALPIPQNEKFDVTDLPDMLIKLKLAEKKLKTINYVWLDLLCIPQVPAEKDWDPLQLTTLAIWLKIQKGEIARQGPIFRNALASIAWLHDVDDLSCLSALCELCSLTYVSRKWVDAETNDQQYESIEEGILDRIMGGSTGLVRGKQSKVPVEGKPTFTAAGVNSDIREPTGWFTSLWTLQEVCLRPDMWLATSTWDILRIGEKEPIPLNGFLSLLTCEPKVINRGDERLKTIMHELKSWSEVTGLEDLLNLSMIDILRLGDRRYCQERRAEAIMSAIGVIDWFIEDENPDTNLILGRYPQKFISAVRSRIPADFFATFAKMPQSDPHDNHQILATSGNGMNGSQLIRFYQFSISDSVETKLRGSMLPFSEMGHLYFRLPPNIDNQSGSMINIHNSIKTWVIGTSGEIAMNQACVLSSSVFADIIKSPTKLPCFFWGFLYRTKGRQKSWMRKVDMHRWTAVRKSEIHMVVIKHGIYFQSTLSENAHDNTTFVFKTYPKKKLGLSREPGYAIQGIVVRCIKRDSKRTAEKEGRIREADEKQHLVKIGNFFACCAGEVILPAVRNVHWEIL